MSMVHDYVLFRMHARWHVRRRVTLRTNDVASRLLSAIPIIESAPECFLAPTKETSISKPSFSPPHPGICSMAPYPWPQPRKHFLYFSRGRFLTKKKSSSCLPVLSTYQSIFHEALSLGLNQGKSTCTTRRAEWVFLPSFDTQFLQAWFVTCAQKSEKVSASARQRCGI